MGQVFRYFTKLESQADLCQKLSVYLTVQKLCWNYYNFSSGNNVISSIWKKQMLPGLLPGQTGLLMHYRRWCRERKFTAYYELKIVNILHSICLLACWNCSLSSGQLVFISNGRWYEFFAIFDFVKHHRGMRECSWSKSRHVAYSKPSYSLVG